MHKLFSLAPDPLPPRLVMVANKLWPGVVSWCKRTRVKQHKKYPEGKRTKQPNGWHLQNKPQPNKCGSVPPPPPAQDQTTPPRASRVWLAGMAKKWALSRTHANSQEVSSWHQQWSHQRWRWCIARTTRDTRFSFLGYPRDTHPRPLGSPGRHHLLLTLEGKAALSEDGGEGHQATPQRAIWIRHETTGAEREVTLGVHVWKVVVVSGAEHNPHVAMWQKRWSNIWADFHQEM